MSYSHNTASGNTASGGSTASGGNATSGGSKSTTQRHNLYGQPMSSTSFRAGDGSALRVKWSNCINKEEPISIPPSDPVHVCAPYSRPGGGGRLNLAYFVPCACMRVGSSTSPPSANASDSPLSCSSHASSSQQSITAICGVTVTLKGVGMVDGDVRTLLNHLETALLKQSTPVHSSPDTQQHRSSSGTAESAVNSTVYFISLDMSENNLTCAGLTELSDWFVKHIEHVRLRTLKCYKNGLSDDAALSLALLVRKQPSPLDELHLSHNRITAIGARALFNAFAEAKAEHPGRCSKCVTNGGGSDGSVSPERAGAPFFRYVYPRLEPVKGVFLPVWIRLEYNRVENTCGLLQRWEQATRQVRKTAPPYTNGPAGSGVCYADRPNYPHGNKSPHCTPVRCVRAGFSHAPLLHLYSFHHQSLLLIHKNGGPVIPASNNGQTTQAALTTSAQSSTAGSRAREQVKEPEKSKVTPSATIRKSNNKNSAVKSSPGQPNTSEAASNSHRPNSTKSSSMTQGGSLPAGPATRDIRENRDGRDPRPAAGLSAPGPPPKSKDASKAANQSVKNVQQHNQSSSEARQAKKSTASVRSGSNGSSADRYPNGPAARNSTAATSVPVSGSSTREKSRESASRIRHELPLYLIVDAESFVEMKDLSGPGRLGEERGVNLLSFPAIHTLCNRGAFRLSQNQRAPSNGRQTVGGDPAAYRSTMGTGPAVGSPRLNGPERNRSDEGVRRAAHTVSNEVHFGNYQHAASLASAELHAPQRFNSQSDADLRLGSLGRPPYLRGPSHPITCGTNPLGAPQGPPKDLIMGRPIGSTEGDTAAKEAEVPEQTLTSPGESVIVMLVNSLEDGLLKILDQDPALRERLLQVHQTHIAPLAALGVVETIEDRPERPPAAGPFQKTGAEQPATSGRWLVLTPSDLSQGTATGLSRDSLRVVDFALVWAHHLSKVSSGSTCSAGPDHTDSHGNSCLRHSFSILVTGNDRVRHFFNYLIQKEQTFSGPGGEIDPAHLTTAATEQGLDSGKGRAAVSSELEDLKGRVSRGNLICFSLEELNSLMRWQFPGLCRSLESGGPYDSKEIISGKSVREMVLSSGKQVNAVDTDRLMAFGSMEARRLGGPRSTSTAANAAAEYPPAIGPAPIGGLSLGPLSRLNEEPFFIPSGLKDWTGLGQRLENGTSPPQPTSPTNLEVHQRMRDLERQNINLRVELRQAYRLIEELLLGMRVS